MSSRKYSFYESDPTLQKILDELVRSREFTPTMHKLLLNGLGKDIQKTKKTLKNRLSMVNKTERLYKTLQTQQKAKTDKAYSGYENYRHVQEKSNFAYGHDAGLVWIEERAKKLGREAEELLYEFEERYEDTP